MIRCCLCRHLGGLCRREDPHTCDGLKPTGRPFEYHCADRDACQARDRAAHAQLGDGHVRCDCGCMWPEPKPPEPPKPPPTPREQIIARAVTAMYAELECQHENGEIGGAGYWDSDWGRLDGEPDWAKVADAALAVVLDDDEPDSALYETDDGGGMVVNCAKCGHPEAEHDPLGCRHENHLEWHTTDNDGITIHTDVSLCGCPYFHEGA